MRRIVETGLKKPAAPHAWAIAANGTLYSVHVPIRPDGSIENGDAAKQTEVTLTDLQRHVVEMLLGTEKKKFTMKLSSRR